MNSMYQAQRMPHCSVSQCLTRTTDFISDYQLVNIDLVSLFFQAIISQPAFQRTQTHFNAMVVDQELQNDLIFIPKMKAVPYQRTFLRLRLTPVPYGCQRARRTFHFYFASISFLFASTVFGTLLFQILLVNYFNMQQGIQRILRNSCLFILIMLISNTVKVQLLTITHFPQFPRKTNLFRRLEFLVRMYCSIFNLQHNF